MNVRFADHSIRFRVAKAELDQLLSGRSVVLEVPMLRSHVFRANVSSSLLSQWRLDSDPTGVWLSVPRLDLEKLAESIPSKEGLEHEFAGDTRIVKVTFEVDVKKSAAMPNAT